MSDLRPAALEPKPGPEHCSKCGFRERKLAAARGDLARLARRLSAKRELTAKDSAELAARQAEVQTNKAILEQCHVDHESGH